MLSENTFNLLFGLGLVIFVGSLISFGLFVQQVTKVSQILSSVPDISKAPQDKQELYKYHKKFRLITGILSLPVIIMVVVLLIASVRR
jgi:hypothetical protein